ncbi:hypothetical protein Kirov_273 [Bacillus phage Kirov]|uniref:Uncharacterized protein n=1 Tax=Bacillus phage Kirov TaxID=2783539 RepID=A0A7U3NKS1_9CAUD|nr:hypothetical protein PQE67_gp031 [Bacillus phage Kirov]QOV08472.1 hypothetical protein Kirov_273 [Bacillus phage Kirov]
MKLNSYVGLVVDNMVITGIGKYYDFSTDKIEQSFVINDKYEINCQLFIESYM